MKRVAFTLAGVQPGNDHDLGHRMIVFGAYEY